MIPVYGQEELRDGWLRFGLQGESFGPDYGTVTEIELSGEDQYVHIIDELEQNIPVFCDFDYVLSLIDLSKDRRGALVIKEPVYLGFGRVSSAYAIIHRTNFIFPTIRESDGAGG